VKLSSPTRSSLYLGVLSTCIAFFAFAAPAMAAPPANDNFANATPLPGPLPQQIAGTNVEATKEIGEPNPAGVPGGASVWYRWTAPANELVTLDTCTETTFDTVLAVYTGAAVNALTEASGNDDACGTSGLQSKTSFSATAGTVYSIAVDGFSGATGTFKLSLSGATKAVTIASSIGPGDPIQSGRLFRNGASSTCEKPNLAEKFDTETHRYKTFPVTSLINENTCLHFNFNTITACEAGSSRVQLSAYDSAFNPADISASLLSAGGLSPPPANAFAATSGTGKTVVLDVNEVEKSATGTGCASFTIEAFSDRPWATTRPLVLSGGLDATGKPVVTRVALAPKPAEWGAGAVIHAYRWQACDAAGNACADIPGANTEKFTPTLSQLGHTLRVVDAATDANNVTASSTSAATGVVYPSNVISFGKFKRNKKKGTGQLTVLVPGPGKLTLTGKGVKKTTRSAKKEGKVALKVAAKGKAKRKLRHSGKVKVKVKVTFKPTGGTAGSKSKKLVLKRKLG
jgi:hypothetical protein